MNRALYRSLLRLHPPAFRREFAGEMLWIFDEAASTEGSIRLIADAFLSLARQWILGCGGWKIAAGLLVALVQLVSLSSLANIGAAVAEPAVRLPSAIDARDIAFSEGLLLVFVLLVGLIGLLGVLRARTASRH